MNVVSAGRRRAAICSSSYCCCRWSASPSCRSSPVCDSLARTLHSPPCEASHTLLPPRTSSHAARLVPTAVLVRYSCTPFLFAPRRAPLRRAHAPFSPSPRIAWPESLSPPLLSYLQVNGSCSKLITAVSDILLLDIAGPLQSEEGAPYLALATPHPTARREGFVCPSRLSIPESLAFSPEAVLRSTPNVQGLPLLFESSAMGLFDFCLLCFGSPQTETQNAQTKEPHRTRVHTVLTKLNDIFYRTRTAVPGFTVELLMARFVVQGITKDVTCALLPTSWSVHSASALFCVCILLCRHVRAALRDLSAECQRGCRHRVVRGGPREPRRLSPFAPPLAAFRERSACLLCCPMHRPSPFPLTYTTCPPTTCPPRRSAPLQRPSDTTLVRAALTHGA